MASPTPQLWLLMFAVVGVQLVGGYSFHNCIAEPHSNRKSFSCKCRRDEHVSAIVNDLPRSVVNLTIIFNPLRRIPNNSFVHLPNLQNLRLDQNQLSDFDSLAFRNLHQLKYLNLSFNHFSELRASLFEDLHNLTDLSLANNKLKKFPEGIFFGVHNLNTLLLRNNCLINFSEIVKSVSHLKKLKTLDLCSNNLTSLHHSNVSLPQSLSMLFLCRNNLHTLGCKLSFLKFVNLLDLSNNLRLHTKAFQGVDLSSLRSLRLKSTKVKIAKFLNISNINAGSVDFSGTGLKTPSHIMELCKILKTRLKRIKHVRLHYNGIKNLTNVKLSHCPKITGFLDLSFNGLKSIECLHFLYNQAGITKFIVEHNHLSSLPYCKKQKMFPFKSLDELNYRYNRIQSVGAWAFIQTPNIRILKLNINTIALLHPKAFLGLKQLELLRLDNNLLTDLYQETFKENVNLKILHLRNNRISVIFKGTFCNLKNLNTLDLGGNKITHFQQSGLDGLKSLSKLYLDGNNLKQIDSSFYYAFQDTLTVLDLASNQIRFFKEKSISPFAKLRKLTDLKLNGQRNYGLTVLPHTLFRGLHSLNSLYLTHNNIVHLPPDAFDDLTGLRFLTLDNCCAGVTQLEPGIFKNLRNLTTLILENMGLQNFSKEVFGNLTQLRVLQMNRNVMQSIPVDALESLPKLNYLDLRNIPLSCTCQNKFLQNYTVNSPNVQVVYLYNLICQQDKRLKFHNFDTKVCYIDLGKYMFFSTAAAVFLFTLIPLLYVKLYWKIKYSYYVFRSWFSDHWSRLREKEENCKYDAFISYNFSDEEWVMNELLPNLEGNGSFFKLCLHHRDFELGRNIVDNIVSAVYSSRKTICVLSRNFLRSEWCSLEIQLASYRLFDEHRDVLLLVVLEPISERQLSSYHRMRKVMLKKTYLQWPGSDCSNPLQAQELFWNKLRRAMKAGSKLEREEDDENKDFET
ncbi:toll-like receptor 21 [Kryptolebias marmoratus]|uniref:Toll-like receptor 21 n=1 Tax=Kryptolebias marmoratus TaxID=37003 RepID=A0A3Q3ABZ4_KRYMA|nr:toll-like receptor 21 [Kryptolebias marmoratus]XP_037836379.1 toll-like receptor 21 [Kryptolebias marmoratus]